MTGPMNLTLLIYIDVKIGHHAYKNKWILMRNLSCF